MEMKNHCSGNCSDCGGCGSCGGSARELTLTEGEIRMLNTFSEIPFLPVARKMGDLNPVYLEQTDYTVEEYGMILQSMEKKGLIALDYDLPLKNFDDSAYAAYPLRGSMALTARGQQVLDLLQLQGVDD